MQAVGPNGPTIQDGYTCTKVGSPGNDTLTATAGDVVCDMGGNDTITASGSGPVSSVASDSSTVTVAVNEPNDGARK